MKNNDFKELLKSIDQARKIHKGRLRPGRIGNKGKEKMIKKMKDTGKTQRVVSFDRVSKALGAEDMGVRIDTSRGPISLFSLRQVLVDQLRSTGDRPGLEGTGDTQNKKN